METVKETLRLAMLCVLATGLALTPLWLLVAWVTSRVSYRVGGTYLRIKLFGICVRRVPLTDIRSISARRPRRGEWAEQWWCTVRPHRRFLTLKRRRGWPRRLVITPLQRYVFRAELEEAIAKLKPAGSAGAKSGLAEREDDDEADTVPTR